MTNEIIRKYKYIFILIVERMSSLLLAFLIAVLASSSVSATNFTIPFKFPTFKQCDQPWANDIMDTKTICSVGCLMTSTVMGLAGSNILINEASGDPRVLNTWLKANGGYDGSNDLIESVVPKIDPSRITWVRIYIYTYIYMHIFTYIYTYLHTNRTYTYTHIHICRQASIR